MLRFIALALLFGCSADADMPTPPEPDRASFTSDDVRPTVEKGESVFGNGNPGRPATDQAPPDTDEGNISIPLPPDDVKDQPAPSDPVDPVDSGGEMPANPDIILIPAPLPEPAKLQLRLPSEFLRAGGMAMDVVGQLYNASGGKILWSVESISPNANPGTIDDKGRYRTPEDITSPLSVKIVGKWDKDLKTTASASLTIVPKEQKFVACKGSPVFPIKADIYRIPNTTTQLPAFNASLEKVASLCKDKFDISDREWTGETPHLPAMEFFAMRAESNIVIPKSDNYSFRLISDDGARVSIDDKVVIDLDGNHPAQFRDASLQLSEGRHKIVVDWYQGGGKLALQVFWKLPGASDFSIIPTTSFAR